MAEFFKPYQKLCQGTSDYKILGECYSFDLKNKTDFDSLSNVDVYYEEVWWINIMAKIGSFNIEKYLKFNLGPLHLLDNFVKEILASDSTKFF